MKNHFLSLLLIAASFLCLTGCCKKTNEPVLHLGLNTEIIEICPEEQILYISGTDESGRKFFEDRRAIDCSRAIEPFSLFYVNYGTEGDVITINFEDFTVGDQIILGIYDSERNKLQTDAMTAEQIQLGTQRLH